MDRPVVTAAKQQAKRLLKLAKSSPLELSKLSQAQEVIAALHGYPSWHAFSTSSGASPPRLGHSSLSSTLSAALQDPSQGRFAQLESDPSAHSSNLVESLGALVKASVWTNLYTANFAKLQARFKDSKGVAFISAEEQHSCPLLLAPFGSSYALASETPFLSQAIVDLSKASIPAAEHIVAKIEDKLAQVARSDAAGVKLTWSAKVWHEHLRRQPHNSEIIAMIPKLWEEIPNIDRHRHQPTSSAFTSWTKMHEGFPFKWMDTPVCVFEISPLHGPKGISAASLLTNAIQMGSHRLASLRVMHEKERFEELMYTRPRLLDWVRALPDADAFYAFHEKRRTMMQSAGVMEWFDQIDGALTSPQAQGTLGARARDARAQGVAFVLSSLLNYASCRSDTTSSNGRLLFGLLEEVSDTPPPQ